MKTNEQIESFLRNNKPEVEENPTFLLEVQQKLGALEGIKAEVDRQWRFGSVSLIISIIGGLVFCALCAFVLYRFSIDLKSVFIGIFEGIRTFVESYKYLLMVPVAGFTIIMCVVFGKSRNSFL